MALPKAARKQISDAEKLHKEIYTDPTVEEGAQDDAAASPEGEDNAAAQAPETAGAVVEDTAAVEPEPQPDGAPEPTTKSVEDFEQKYKSLQGRWKAEMGRRDGELDMLRGKVDTLEKLATGQADPEPDTAPAQQRLLSEEEIADYGEDMVDMVKRAAREEFASTINTLKQENAELKSKMGQVTTATAQSAKDRLFSRLDNEVQGWRDINNSDEFVDWLAQIDQYSGYKRHDLLLEAFNANDEARTLAFFRGYLNENAAVTPPQAAPRQPGPKVDLDTLVAPGTPKSTGMPRTQEGDNSADRIWTQAEVQNFYDRITAGKYRGKEKERLKTERQIIEAANQGRIR